MGAGRPTEDLSSLPDKWYDKVLKEYSEGAADIEIKAMIWNWRGSFSNNLWDRWMNDEPEFWETIKKGRALSEAWWNKKGRKNLDVKDFNYTGWYMNMKNRFGWADKSVNENKNTEVKTLHLDKLSDADLRKIADMQRKIGTSEA